MGGIYKYRNKINNKIYIGQSIDLEHRKIAHKSAAYSEKSNEYDTELSKAIREFGIENFEYDVLAKEIEDREVLNYLEQYYIYLFDCLYPKGYNKTYGGDTHCSWTKKQKENFSFSKGELAEEEVISLRMAYKEKESPSVVYQKYRDRITWGGFINIWRGVRYSHIMPEVFSEKKPRTKLTKEQVLEIRERYKNEKTTYKLLAQDYGVTSVTIGNIITNYTWKNI